MLKDDFPILSQTKNGKGLAYLDNAATTQKPKPVISAIVDYYLKSNANVHRGVYELSVKATEAYENAHKIVADFINADFEEIIFTKGTTESINLLAYSLGSTLKEGDEIVLTKMEHHSNLVPWQQLAKEKSLTLKFIPLKDYRLDMNAAKKLITKKTKIVSVIHMSNVLGTINPVRELAKIAHENGALLIVDAAQSVSHMKIDVKSLGCDFLAFSGHKMLAPTGIGILFGKKNILQKMKPFLYGGDMIEEVTFENSRWNELPWKFEAGTPNIEGAVGLAAAINYLKKIGMENIERHNLELTEYALRELQKINGLKIIGPDSLKERGQIISFSMDGIHPHDVCEILGKHNVAARGGHHCAMPLMSELKIEGATRISFCIYNTKEDIDQLTEGLKRVREIFK